MHNKMGIQFLGWAMAYSFLLSATTSVVGHQDNSNWYDNEWSNNSSLRVGFYQSTCPAAELIVSRVVDKFVSINPGLGAGLIRLHFHDCFVRGCDASVLLDSTPGNPSERESKPNKHSLRGFEVIDEAKAQLEDACPQTVSCADIIAFSARDSAFKLGAIRYSVPSGRRDGTVSLASEAKDNLPAFFFNVEKLRDNFAKKGMSIRDMVTLSGAHSVGFAHCSSFSGRLYPAANNGTQKVQDQEITVMNAGFACQLRDQCPSPTNVPNSKVPLDDVTPRRLDNRYFANLRKGRGLLTSDQTLMTEPETAAMVRGYGRHGKFWARKFARAMVKMGLIEVKTGALQGQIRKNCRFVN